MEQVKTAQGRCHRCVHGRGPFREVEVVVAEVEEGEKAAPRLMACSTNGGMLQKEKERELYGICQVAWNCPKYDKGTIQYRLFFFVHDWLNPPTSFPPEVSAEWKDSRIPPNGGKWRSRFRRSQRSLACRYEKSGGGERGVRKHISTYARVTRGHGIATRKKRFDATFAKNIRTLPGRVYLHARRGGAGGGGSGRGA